MFIETLTLQSAQAAPAVGGRKQEALIAHLRENLSPREIRMFGLEPVEDKQEPLPTTQVVSGVGAGLSTALLFVVVGFFATLGLPDAGLVASTAAAIV
jgi:hypothetical protein